MNDVKEQQRKVIEERLEIVRAKLRATGATVLSPTAEWTALRKEMLELNRKLKQPRERTHGRFQRVL